MRLLVSVLLLSLPAYADGAMAMFSMLAVGGPLVPIFAVAWGHKRAKGMLSRTSKWCALALSLPATAVACRFTGGFILDRLAVTKWSILCGPFFLLSCFLAAGFPAFLLRAVSVARAEPVTDFEEPTPASSRVVQMGIPLGVAMFSTVLLFMALYVYPQVAKEPGLAEAVAPWKDADIDPRYQVTINRVGLGMTYHDIVRISGFPIAAWRQKKTEAYQKLFTENELNQLRKNGLTTNMTTVRFKPSFGKGKTHVLFDNDGKAVKIYGDHLEFSGHQIASADDPPPWLPPLKSRLPPPDDLEMTSHSRRSYYYRRLGLRIDAGQKMSFSLHSERESSF